MTEITTSSPRPMRTWLRVLLVLSLALNLLIVGGVAGMALRHDRHAGRDGPPGGGRIGGPLTYALSPEDRNAIGRRIGQAYREARPGRADLRTEYEAVIAALRADPFDPAAVEDSLARQRRLAGARLELGHSALLERLGGMSLAQRTDYADRLQEALEWRERHRRDRED